jgi:hypothetical protein
MNRKIVARLDTGNFVVVFNSSNPGFLKVEESYSEPILTAENVFEFNPDRKIHKDDWQYIQMNDNQKGTIIQPYIDTISSSESTNPITGDDYSKIEAICLVEKSSDSNEGKIFLTRIFPRYYMMSKKYFKWNDGPDLITEAGSVDFPGALDAYWDGQKLFFKSYGQIKSVFPGIEIFYRTATEEEKDRFLTSDIFECESAVSVKERNLKKIAGIIDKPPFDLNDKAVQTKLLTYAKEFPEVTLNITEEGKFKITSNKDLTSVLNLLEERVYKTPITAENREAHSVTKLTS